MTLLTAQVREIVPNLRKLPDYERVLTDPEAEPVQIEVYDSGILFTLDDGTEIVFDPQELRAAVSGSLGDRTTRGFRQATDPGVRGGQGAQA